MANVLIRRENESRNPSPTYGADWEPIRLMRNMLQWDPFREMTAYAADDRYSFAPAFDVKETKEGYLFKADVPGVAENDLEITLTGNRLVISGKRESERQDASEKFYAFERTYGSFTRTFTLPNGVDGANIHADLRDGVLTLMVPRSAETQPRKIAIKPSAGKS